MRIKGITVILHERVQTGTDAFNRPIYRVNPVPVENVLVSPVGAAEEILDRTNMSGDKVTYWIAIPKGDEHTWEGNEVEFFGNSYKAIGNIIQGIEENIPLLWNKKIQVMKVG